MLVLTVKMHSVLEIFDYKSTKCCTKYPVSRRRIRDISLLSLLSDIIETEILLEKGQQDRRMSAACCLHGSKRIIVNSK